MPLCRIHPTNACSHVFLIHATQSSNHTRPLRTLACVSGTCTLKCTNRTSESRVVTANTLQHTHHHHMPTHAGQVLVADKKPSQPTPPYPHTIVLTPLLTSRHMHTEAHEPDKRESRVCQHHLPDHTGPMTAVCQRQPHNPASTHGMHPSDPTLQPRVRPLYTNTVLLRRENNRNRNQARQVSRAPLAPLPMSQAHAH